MNKEIFIQELNRKNTETVENVLKDLYDLVYKQQEQITSLNSTISTIQNRLTNLEQVMLIQKVQLTGLGPSVKD